MQPSAIRMPAIGALGSSWPATVATRAWAPLASFGRVGSVGGETIAGNPLPLIRTTEPYDFDHVPPPVSKEIKEALDCLSVGAHNGFGGCCRRAIQALCTNLGAEASTKVKNQVQEMAAATGLEQEWVDLFGSNACRTRWKSPAPAHLGRRALGRDPVSTPRPDVSALYETWQGE